SAPRVDDHRVAAPRVVATLAALLHVGMTVVDDLHLGLRASAARSEAALLDSGDDVASLGQTPLQVALGPGRDRLAVIVAHRPGRPVNLCDALGVEHL